MENSQPQSQQISLWDTVEPESKKQSPALYEQYVSLKFQHPDYFVLVRLGDFYEAFNEDAETLSEELNLTMTSRDVGLENRAPLVGFPCHISDTYIAKIRINRGVVIIENDGEIVTLEKINNDSQEPIKQSYQSFLDQAIVIFLYELLDGEMDIVGGAR